jgi:tetratricopeptide (TPR) repeat protein
MSMVSDGDEQLMTAMRRWLVQHFRQGNTDSDVSHLIRYLVRSSLSSGDTDFGFPVDLIQHFGVPEEEQEQIRLTQIALAPTDSATANLWLQWADSLDTKEAQLKGEPAALEFLEDKYRKAVELRPDFHEALHNWGVALWNWAKFKKGAEANELFAKACDKFDEALDIHPDSYRSLASFGKALAAWAKNTTNGEAEKLFERAFEKLERALTIKPNDQEALFSLGCLAALRGDTSGAISALERWKNVNSEASKADLDNDSDFDRVRLDPQFERFRESLADL